MLKTIADIDCIHKLNERFEKNKKTIDRLTLENNFIPKRIKQVESSERNQLTLNDLIIKR